MAVATTAANKRRFLCVGFLAWEFPKTTAPDIDSKTVGLLLHGRPQQDPHFMETAMLHG